MQYSSNRLCEEVVLLISSAKSKNIDISVWLTEDGSDGKVAVPDFNSKLISLGLIVGMGESSVKKSKLDYATSDTSLGRILIICRAGKDSNGVALIDVSKFLKTCDRMLTSSINDSIVTSLSDYNLSDSVEMDIAESHKNVCRDEWNAVHGIDNEENVDINVSFGTSDVIREGDVPQILSERLKSQRSYKYASSTPFNTENEYRGGKIGFEKANISDRYSDSCFLELKHANQWKLGNSGSTTERTMDELYSEENEIENYDGNNLDDDYIIDTASTSVKSAYASQIEDQAFQSLHPKETPLDNCMLRQSSDSLRRPTSSASVKYSKVTASGRKKRLTNSTQGLEMDSKNQMEKVERLVRNAVRQTDLYHLIQVHLGFIKCYTIVPPRGAIVSSNPRPWLSVTDIQKAFYAGRVCMNDAQVYALSALVQLYSKDTVQACQDIIAENDEEMEQNVEKLNVIPAPLGNSKSLFNKASHQPTTVPLPKHVVSPSRKISAEWLKRYLVYLRLTKKSEDFSAVTSSRNIARCSSSVPSVRAVSRSRSADPSRRSLGQSKIKSDSPQLPTDPSEDPGPALESEEIRPVPWSDWLEIRVQQDKQTLEGKPKELRKALGGKPHTLSKSDVNSLLKGLNIIPDSIMKDEIQYRVDCWVKDTNGRRDFLHILNLELRKWEIKTKTDFKILSEQKGEKALRRGITKIERESVKSIIKKELIEKKILELEYTEISDIMITTELFEKYDNMCRDNKYVNCIVWGDWLEKNRNTNIRQLHRFEEGKKEREILSANKSARKHSVGSLTEIHRELCAASESFPTFHGIEIRKGLQKLRNATLNRSSKQQQENALISKDDFDQYLGKVLAPFVNQLPDNLKMLVFENRKNNEMESNMVDTVNKEMKNKKCDDEILINRKKEEKTSGNDDDTDDNYDDYADEFENEETNSQMNVNDNDKNMENKENVKKEDFYAKKVVHYNTKIDDINDKFFSFNEEVALNRIIEHRNENDIKKKKEFAVWKLKKDLENKLIDEKNKKEKEQLEKDKLMREKKGKNAYNKWLILAQKNRYYSQIDGKKKIIPQRSSVKHGVAWNQEMDLNDYYTNIDRKYY